MTGLSVAAAMGVTAIVGGIAAAGGIATSSVAAKQNKDYADQQLQLGRETNATNMEINKMNIENQWKMYEDQKLYNSAAQQRQRIEQAGLNPYLMLNGGSAGQAETVSQPASLPMQTPNVPNPTTGMQNLSGQLMSVPSQISHLSDMGLKMAETNDITTTLPFKIAKMEADTFLSLIQQGKTAAEAKQIVQQMDFFDEVKEDYKKGIDLDNKTKDASIRLAEQQIINQSLTGDLLRMDIKFRSVDDAVKLQANLQDAIGKKFENILKRKEIDIFDDKNAAIIKQMLADAAYKEGESMKLSGWTKEKSAKYIDALVKDCQEAARLTSAVADTQEESLDILKVTKDDQIQLSHDRRKLSKNEVKYSDETLDVRIRKAELAPMIDFFNGMVQYGNYMQYVGGRR